MRILETVDAAKAAVREGHYDPPARLAVGLAEHAACEPFTRFLFELEHRQPPIAVDVREVAPAEAVRLVAAHELDLSIVLEPVDAAGLCCVQAWTEPLSIILPIGHPRAEQNRVCLSELDAEPFILPPPSASPGYVKQVEALLARHGAQPTKRVAAKHQRTMVSFVATGRGLSLLPESVALVSPRSPCYRSGRTMPSW